MIFLKQPHSFYEEAGRLSEIGINLLLDTGAIINALPFEAGEWRKRTGFMHEVRREGVEL